MIQIQGFSKSYDGIKYACQDIDLTIEPGDLYGFIGHNGAGKTTLLKAIAGIHSFNRGTIRVCGHSIQDEPLPAKRLMAYIPDNPDIYESLKGAQYLDFIADVFGLTTEERVARIDRFASMFELQKALAQPISTYSHGMKQKLVLISALIHQPKVLLLDEPFVGLDPKASYLLKEVFQQMRQQGTAIFFSTHVLDVAEKICNKIAIIKQGRIVASGATSEIVKDQSLESLFLELLEE